MSQQGLPFCHICEQSVWAVVVMDSLLSIRRLRVRVRPLVAGVGVLSLCCVPMCSHRLWFVWRLVAGVCVVSVWRLVAGVGVVSAVVAGVGVSDCAALQLGEHLGAAGQPGLLGHADPVRAPLVLALGRREAAAD